MPTRRLPLVKDFGGHAALLNGLANDFRDGHIIVAMRFCSQPARMWAGLIMARSGGRWVVGAQDKAEPTRFSLAPGCSLRRRSDADRFARDRIGTFLAHPDIEADLASACAYTLLLDDQSIPSSSVPVSCRFQARERNRFVDHRAAVARKIWSPRVCSASIGEQPISRGRPGWASPTFAGGHWIALEKLGNDAATVVEQVRARQAALARFADGGRRPARQ